MIFFPMRFVFNRRGFLLSGIYLVILTFSLACLCPAQDETDEAVKIFNQAQEAHEKGDFQAALKSYDEAIKLLPEFPEAEYQRGNALISLGKTDEAEKAFRRALELRADWSLPMTNLGALLVQKNNFAEAEKLLTRAIEENELNFAAYSALTDLRLKTKAKPEVLKELLTKIQPLTSKANPTASIWASRAALENALGDKSAAKTSLNRALAINPNDKSALLELAEIALAESDRATATEAVKTLEKTAPNSAALKFLQARILASSGNTGEAVKVLDSIEDPTSEVADLRGKILANNSINVVELEKQLENDGKNPVILGRLCTILRTESPTKALDYCKRALEVEPNNVNHAVGFGAALVQTRQYDDAVTVLRKILQIAPDNFTARANLATALFQSKRFAEAKTEYIRLTEKQPNLAIAYYFLAIVYDSLEEYMDAAANYQQFLKIADSTQNKLEIEKVNLRLPSVMRLIKEKKGKK